MDYYEVQGQIDSAIRDLRSDVEYYADRQAQDARSDAQRYAEALLDEHATDNHISFKDLRDGLAELSDRVSELERLLVEKDILSDA